MTAPAPPSAPALGRPRRWVAGALAAAIAGGVGYQAATWPEVAALARRNPETTAFLEQYRERQRAAGEPGALQWEWVPDERISPHLKRAVVAAEDMEFFAHRGFSSAELKDALTQALRKLEAPRGASTITQQLAKNLWLSPSRNPLRKLKEALLTRQLERHLTKRRILELYLNVVELGPGIYGAEAAARHYFGKPASDLTEHEAAQLAASLPRPATWHPGRDTEAYMRYVAEIERRMSVATFLWRALGAEPAPPAALVLDPDSLLAMLQDTLGLLAEDTIPWPPAGDTTGRAPVDQDSAAAVAAAIDALLVAYPGQAGRVLTVAAFTRDTAGFLVDLVSGPGPDSATTVGGLVRVGKDGTATVVHPRR